MFCVIVTKPMITARIGTLGTPGSSGLLEPGDKWVEIQEHIISRAFTTKAKADRWAYRQGGIEEHDAQLVARGETGEFYFFKENGGFHLCETSQYPARTHLSLVDLGTRELPAEPALAEIARQHAMEREREREREQAEAARQRALPRNNPNYECDNGDYPSPF